MPSSPASAALPVQRARQFLRHLPGFDVRRAFLLHEAPHLLAESFVILGVEGVFGGHVD